MERDKPKIAVGGLENRCFAELAAEAQQLRKKKELLEKSEKLSESFAVCGTFGRGGATPNWSGYGKKCPTVARRTESAHKAMIEFLKIILHGMVIDEAKAEKFFDESLQLGTAEARI